MVIKISIGDSLATKRVTPHLIRRGTAIHLLQPGVDIIVVALWLGDEDVQTTHICLQADINQDSYRPPGRYVVVVH